MRLAALRFAVWVAVVLTVSALPMSCPVATYALKGLAVIGVMFVIGVLEDRAYGPKGG